MLILSNCVHGIVGVGDGIGSGLGVNRILEALFRDCTGRMDVNTNSGSAVRSALFRNGSLGASIVVVGAAF